MSIEKILNALVNQGVSTTADQKAVSRAAKECGETIVVVKRAAVTHHHLLKVVAGLKAEISDLQKLNEERGPVTMNEIEAQELVSFDLLGLLWKRADEKCRRHCLEVFGTEQPTPEMLR